MEQPHTKCATLRVLEKKRELYEAGEELEAARAEFERKSEEIRRRGDELQKKDRDLQTSVAKFSQFLSENDEKRLRAERRCAEDKKLCEEMDAEIASLTQALEEKTAEGKQLAQDVDKNARYHRYLRAFLEHVRDTRPDQFTDIQDVLHRYSSLTKTRSELLDWQQKATADGEEKQQSYVSLVKEQGNAMINKNNEIASLQKELEVCSVSRSEMQISVHNNLQGAADKTIELGRTLMAIENLLDRFERQPHRYKKRMEKERNAKMRASQNGGEETAENKDSETFESRGFAALQALDTIAAMFEDYRQIVLEHKHNEQQ